MNSEMAKTTFRNSEMAKTTFVATNYIVKASARFHSGVQLSTNDIAID